MNSENVRETGARYARSLAEVIETMSGLAMALREGVTAGTDAAIVAVAGLDGAQSGLLSLKTDTSTLRRLTSYMTGLPEEDLGEAELIDCIHELMNMTIGHAKSTSAEEAHKHKMVAPFVLLGDEVRTLQKEDATYAVWRLENDDIFLELRISF